MPDPVTIDTIKEAANSPASATQDGMSAAAVPISEQIKALDKSAVDTALSGTSSNGGPVSMWSKLRMARAINCGGPQ